MHHRAYPTLVLAFALAACTAGSGSRKDPFEQERRERHLAAAARGEIRMGMPMDIVRKAWGAPQKRDHATVRGSRLERWWYPSTFVYFGGDDRVVGWESPLG